MKHETKHRSGGAARAVRSAAAAALALALLAGAQPARAGHAPGCDANRPPADHLNVYSNLLAAVGEIQKMDTASTTLYGKVKASRDDLDNRRSALADLSNRYRTLDSRFEQILADVSRLEATARYQDTIAKLKEARAESEKCGKKAEELLRGNDGTTKDVETAKAEAERAQKDFGETAVSLEERIKEANRIWLRYGNPGKKWGCIDQLRDRYVQKANQDLESNRRNLAGLVSDIATSASEISKLGMEVETKRQTIENFPGKIARELGDRSVSTIDGLLDFLADRAAPQAKVFFRDGGQTVLNGPLSIKRKTADDPGTPLDRPADPVPQDDGLSFLWWKERNTGREFTAWGQPVEADKLELDAVWGYRVRVSGITNVFFVVKEDQATPTFAAVFVDPVFEAFQDEKREEARPGETFAGWRYADDATGATVERQTPVRRSCRIEAWYREALYTVTWCNADGTVIQTESVGYGEKLRKRELPTFPPEYQYLHWSDARDGEAWEGWGSELRGDLKLFAVRERKHKVTLKLADNRTTFATLGFLSGEEFSPLAADTPPEAPGERFLGWFGPDGRDFAGGKVYDDMHLVAKYRKETFPEFVERSFRSVQGRFPLPLLAGADVALLVILVAIAVTGAAPRAPRPKKERKAAEKAAKEAPAETPPTADGTTAESPSADGADTAK